MSNHLRIDVWREYLTAFDDLLAAKRDPTTRLLARRRMVAFLEADPEYWRALGEHHVRHRDAAERRCRSARASHEERRAA